MSYKLSNEIFEGLDLMYISNSPVINAPKINLYPDNFIMGMVKMLKSTVLYSFYKIFAADMPSYR